jgi:hypothetical protein
VDDDMTGKTEIGGFISTPPNDKAIVALRQAMRVLPLLMTEESEQQWLTESDQTKREEVNNMIFSAFYVCQTAHLVSAITDNKPDELIIGFQLISRVGWVDGSVVALTDLCSLKAVSIYEQPYNGTCMISSFEKQIVLRASRLIRVRKRRFLFSIFWAFRLPTTCFSLGMNFE